eukprot:jgi/Psemu1/43467/gm1.43467_g
MAPKNHRIVSLDDINQGRSFLPPHATGASSSNGSQSRFGFDEYCRPVSQGHAPPSNQKHAVPLSAIPRLPQNDVCAGTLERILKEFFPIIKRRGYNVTSISELCCCGDGLDHAVQRGRKRKKCRRMGNNVWGYNQTTFGRVKSHSIHLRLRHPHNHQLLPWEDVAGTMAHELSHCVHQNHGSGFYKLMEEILEEHAMIQIHGLSGQSFLRPANVDTLQSVRKWEGGPTMRTVTVPTAASPTESYLPESGGNRLGGNNATRKSRLLDEYPSGGRKLGGGASAGTDKRQLRELIARAAESRQRQMLQIRRMIERSKEPCVIEIFDDDDEVGGNNTDKDSKHRSTFATARNTKFVNQERERKRRKAGGTGQKGSKKDVCVIDLTVNDIDTTIITEWSCGRCTFRNKGCDNRCDVCLGQR